MTDAQLIAKFRNGDLNAFNTLVWRWEKPVYNFVYRYVGNREDARDLCQKTFIRVYRKANKLRDANKFSTWLFQIAVNLCRDELKRQKRRHHVSLEQLQENGNGTLRAGQESNPKNQAQPDQALHRLELSELINRALQHIPEEQRAVIVMKEFQGLKFTEIAEVLETSVNTAKSRMYYGLTALRKVFDKWQINQETLRHEM